jgi:TonB-dependent SusC/RagA subfamily outer membrane receptor
MKHTGVHLYVRCAVLGTYLAASTSCLRQPRTDAGAGHKEGRGADSAFSALAERNRSSATQSVSFNDGERARFTRVEQMIQARFAGVQVTQRGNTFAIRIRGTGSLTSNSEPLVVIDGTPRSTADLRGVNPKDVARIAVMKDAAASFYGVRGANGVIVINTRRGH